MSPTPTWKLGGEEAKRPNYQRFRVSDEAGSEPPGVQPVGGFDARWGVSVG